VTVRHRYARTVDEGRALREALRFLLVCPLCGVSKVRDHKKSMTAVVVKCLGCGLKYHIKRVDLAASARRKADGATDPDERGLLLRLARLFDPPGQHDGYAGWRKHNEWSDPSLDRA
jgi:hypothetical protein